MNLDAMKQLNIKFPATFITTQSNKNLLPTDLKILEKLAKQLVDCIDSGTQLTLNVHNELFRMYHYALVDEVLDFYSQTFKKSFIDYEPENLSEGTLKLCEIFLKKCNHNLKEMEALNYEISEVQKMTDEEIKPLPTDYIEEKDIHDFFDQLIFAVNQPNEIELGKIMSRELRSLKKINLRDGDLFASYYQKYILDYMKEKHTRELHKIDFDNFYEGLAHKLASQQLIGCSKANLNRLKRIKKDYKIFIQNTENSFKLNSNKLVEHLSSEPSLKQIDSYIFLTSDQLLDLEDMVVLATKSKLCDLLIIEVRTKKELHQNMLKDAIVSNLNRTIYILPLGYKFKKLRKPLYNI